MNAPTDKALTRWWDEQPEGNYTCSGCGRTDDKTYVQPQHPFYANGREDTALCGDCLNDANAALRAARKAELDAMPRCEIEGCQRRGAQRLVAVLLCGRHAKRVQEAHHRNMRENPFSIFAPTPDYSRDQLVKMATSQL